jgi:hypothetical protein
LSDLGNDSTSASTVAPVVVNPLTLSNIASVNDWNAPLKYSGMEPKTQIAIHRIPTTPNASCIPTTAGFPLTLNQKAAAKDHAQSIGRKNGRNIPLSPSATATASGSRSEVPAIPSTYVNIRKTV